jgi:hypothetical protein
MFIHDLKFKHGQIDQRHRLNQVFSVDMDCLYFALKKVRADDVLEITTELGREAHNLASFL